MGPAEMAMERPGVAEGQGGPPLARGGRRIKGRLRRGDVHDERGDPSPGPHGRGRLRARGRGSCPPGRRGFGAADRLRRGADTHRYSRLGTQGRLGSHRPSPRERGALAREPRASQEASEGAPGLLDGLGPNGPGLGRRSLCLRRAALVVRHFGFVARRAALRRRAPVGGAGGGTQGCDGAVEEEPPPRAVSAAEPRARNGDGPGTRDSTAPGDHHGRGPSACSGLARGSPSASCVGAVIVGPMAAFPPQIPVGSIGLTPWGPVASSPRENLG